MCEKNQNTHSHRTKMPCLPVEHWCVVGKNINYSPTLPGRSDNNMFFLRKTKVFTLSERSLATVVADCEVDADSSPCCFR